MSSPTHRVVKAYACRCRNITITAYDIALTESSGEFERAFIGDDGIRIIHPYLTLRTRDHTQKDSDKYIQRLTLHCLECKTKAYRVVQDVPPGSEAREGPVTPNDGWIEQEIVTSRNGWIEVLLGPNGCLDGNDAIEAHFRNLKTSDTFSIAIPSVSSEFSTLFSTPLHPLQTQDSDGTDQYSVSTPLNMLKLSELPSLFPPPPFTPSHPVFQLLSNHAHSTSADWRNKAEGLVRQFLKLQLEELGRREGQLRAEVETIWKNYREAWKEVIAEINESRLAYGEISSPSGKKPSTPVSIRDFSPVIPHSPNLSDTIKPSSNHDTASFSISSPISASFNRMRPVFSSLSSKGSSLNHLSARNEVSLVKDQVQLSSPDDHGELSTSAFKRNMDTDADIATSLRWAEGEEALRKRFETKKEDHRARKRTSKSLDIPSGDIPMQPEVTAVEAVANKAETSAVKPSEDQTKKKQKRRVTFDINSKDTFKTVPTDAIEELFDLDDFSPEKPSPIGKDKEVIRTPTYKLHQNSNKVSRDTLVAGSLPSFINSSQPSPSPRVPISINGLKRRPGIINISNTLPLLSSSVPANDRILPVRISSLTSKVPELPSLPENGDSSSNSPGEEAPQAIHKHDNTIRQMPPIPPEASGEAEFRNLFAASAPSHRHAWKEGGNAWNMFHRINSNTSDPDTPTTEDDDGEGEELSNEPVSDNEGYLQQLAIDGWKSPAQLARSLPIQIRPPPQYTRVLELKTSLADKQGILVPPLKFNIPKSSTEMRKAVYADRDLSRSVDPGPTLNMDEDIDEESKEILTDDQDRGRRHALSILQARSTVPEAGMWRSLAT